MKLIGKFWVWIVSLFTKKKKSAVTNVTVTLPPPDKPEDTPARGRNGVLIEYTDDRAPSQARVSKSLALNLESAKQAKILGHINKNGEIVL